VCKLLIKAGGDRDLSRIASSERGQRVLVGAIALAEYS